MTPAEFKSIRHGLGLSARAMARLLAVKNQRTIRKWESGTNNISGPAQILMRLLRDGIITPAELAASDNTAC